MVVRNNFEEVSPHFKTSYLTVYPKDKVNLKGNPLVIGRYGEWSKCNINTTNTKRLCSLVPRYTVHKQSYWESY